MVQAIGRIAGEIESIKRKVLDVNRSECHIRVGLATREKYLHQRMTG